MGAYLKVRQDDRIVSVAAIIVVTANTDGHRVIIGLGLGPSEVENFSKDFLCGLKVRGLDGAKLVISDAHSGLRASVKRVFEAAWQRLSRSWDAKCSRPCLPRPAHRRGRTRHCPRTNGGSMARSDRPSTSQTAPVQVRPGVRWQTNSAPGGPSWQNSWTTANTTCWPTWGSARSCLGPSTGRPITFGEPARRCRWVRAVSRTSGVPALTPERGLDHAPDRRGAVRTQLTLADLRAGRARGGGRVPAPSHRPRAPARPCVSSRSGLRRGRVRLAPWRPIAPDWQ